MACGLTQAHEECSLKTCWVAVHRQLLAFLSAKSLCMCTDRLLNLIPCVNLATQVHAEERVCLCLHSMDEAHGTALSQLCARTGRVLAGRPACARRRRRRR